MNVEQLESIILSAGYDPSEIMMRCRNREIIVVRQTLMYILKKKGLKLMLIGNLFEMDHATVIHSVKKLNGILEMRFAGYFDYLEAYERLTEAIQNFEIVTRKMSNHDIYTDLNKRLVESMIRMENLIAV